MFKSILVFDFLYIQFIKYVMGKTRILICIVPIEIRAVIEIIHIIIFIPGRYKNIDACAICDSFLHIQTVINFDQYTCHNLSLYSFISNCVQFLAGQKYISHSGITQNCRNYEIWKNSYTHTVTLFFPLNHRQPLLLLLHQLPFRHAVLQR